MGFQEEVHTLCDARVYAPPVGSSGVLSTQQHVLNANFQIVITQALLCLGAVQNEGTMPTSNEHSPHHNASGLTALTHCLHLSSHSLLSITSLPTHVCSARVQLSARSISKFETQAPEEQISFQQKCYVQARPCNNLLELHRRGSHHVSTLTHLLVSSTSIRVENAGAPALSCRVLFPWRVHGNGQQRKPGDQAFFTQAVWG